MRKTKTLNISRELHRELKAEAEGHRVTMKHLAEIILKDALRWSRELRRLERKTWAKS